MVPEEEPLTRLSEDWSPSEPEEAGAGGLDVFAETLLLESADIIVLYCTASTVL